MGVEPRWSTQMAEVLAKQAELALDNSDRSMAAIRARYAKESEYWNEGGPSVGHTELRLPTPHGTVRSLVYRIGATPAPVIVYLHGGGYIVGSPETHDRITRTLAHSTGAVVISVDYTLSPEAKHPQPIEQCVAVVEQLRARAEELRILADDIALAGDSAGAHIALASQLWLSDRSSAAGIRCLLLFYGSYGLRDSASRRGLGGDWDGMSAKDLAWYQACYLDEDQLSDPYYDLLGRDLSAVPPCYLLATDLDPLLDDSLELKARLSGDRHRLVVAQGVLHAFLGYARVLDAAEEHLALAAEFYLGVGGKLPSR